MSSAGADPLLDGSRRSFVRIAAAAVALGGASAAAWPLIDQMNPASDVLDDNITFDLDQTPAGQQAMLRWRRKPLFIRHRTEAEIAAAEAEPLAKLRYPEPDARRVKPGHAAWLVLLGVCTFEGCTPTIGGGEFGGWFCPCCGSQFDLSGRARIGPARANLVVPDYSFPTGHTLRVAGAMPIIPSGIDAH
jgi:ubiquinol-cytochrome c reductase iron-sulfur subunit